MGCLIHKSLKFYNNVFNFVGLTTLGTEFWLNASLELSFRTFQALILIYRRGNLVYYIGDVHNIIDGKTDKEI